MKSGLAAEHVVEVKDIYTDTVVSNGAKKRKALHKSITITKDFVKFIVLFLLGSSCREFF